MLSHLALYEKGEIGSDEEKPNHLLFAVSSDRGLCGGIHSGMAKAIKAKLEAKESGSNPMLVIHGDKVRSILQRSLGNKFTICIVLTSVYKQFTNA